MKKICKQCSKEFVVEDDDLAFYKKISPTFAGKTFEIPAPTLCSDCREIRRELVRNELSLYKRKSDKSGQEMVSALSPDKKLVVYSPKEWWADDWDATSYGIDFDFSRPFFEQAIELYKKVPKLALNNTNNENTDYGNYIDGVKDCYMSFVCYFGSEKVMYSYIAYTDRNCMDLTIGEECENCYYLVGCTKDYDCSFCENVHNSRNCRFSFDLIGCADCLFCNNLRRQQYCIENKQYSKEDYTKKLKEFNFGSYKSTQEYFKKWREIKENSIVKFANMVNCEDCVGDDLVNCKNLKNCFGCNDVENAKFTYRAVHMKDAMDFMCGGAERVYEVTNIGYGTGFYFCDHVLTSNNMYYCRQCFNCSDCFGCVGLRHKQFCIFNKQISSKAEYEKEVSKIIEHMQKTQEWGEFFPIHDTIFGYNETIADIYFPKTKEEALEFGAKWQDDDFALKHDGPFYEPKDDIVDYKNDETERQKLLGGILKCEVSGKAFKIMPQELAFYLEHDLPIPHKHFNVRFKERFDMRNPRKLYHRNCMNKGPSVANAKDGKCENEFETTYAPDRPEKVYCESCYQKSVL